MRVSIALLALANPLAMAQNFFSSNDVPACALNCDNLNNAQRGCLPPANLPATCFCNSAYLVGLAAQPQAICPGCTSQGDLSQLAGWFSQFCTGGGSTTYQANGAATSAPATAATSPAQVVSTAAAAGGATATAPDSFPTSTANGSADGSSGSSAGDGYVPYNSAHRSWWDLHKGWIAMVIVLIIGFAIIIAVGIWWKKRYIRKRDAAGATLPGAWGPSQNQHPNSMNTSAEKSRSSSRGPSKAGVKQKIARSFGR